MKKHKNQVVVIIAATAILMGGYVLWLREPEHTKPARELARELKVVGFDLRDVAERVYGASSREVLFRTQSPGSNRLLLREANGVVFEYDADTGLARQAPFEAWDAATGDIADDTQIFHHPEWNHDQKTGRLTHRGVSAETRGRNHMSLVSSPSGEKIAIISADGRYKPGSTGWVFGGSWARASGQHYVEILRVSDGEPLIEPLAIPFRTNWRRGIHIFWTADERFVICRTEYSKYCVIPTSSSP